MKMWMLKGGTVIVAAGALLTVISTWSSSDLHKTPEMIPATKLSDHRQADFPAPDLASPPQARSEKSRNMDVSIATRLRPKGTVTVGGHVRSPGPVSFTGSLTLEQAIERAGGATEFGLLRRVWVTRDGERKTYDATKDDVRSLTLQANDTVEVPQKFVGGR